MENIDDEYRNHWETNMFLQIEELDCYLGEAIGASNDESSSPEGVQMAKASKSIVSERNRRKKLNQRLCALRSVVPNITKMDKASVIRDAIEYIRSLQGEERRIRTEISEVESRMSSNSSISDAYPEATTMTICSQPKRARMDHFCDSAAAGLVNPPPIEIHELRVSNVGEKTIVVSLVCNKRRDTMIKLCEAFESLKLNIISCSVNASCGWLLKTMFLEGDEKEKDGLRVKIEAAIAALNGPHCPPSSSLDQHT